MVLELYSINSVYMNWIVGGGGYKRMHERWRHPMLECSSVVVWSMGKSVLWVV